MKKLLVIFLLLSWLPLGAQNPEVENRLKSRYSSVQYNKECGGWYLLSYSKAGQMMYGFADKKGNVVVQDGSKYKIHPGYIEFYILDSRLAQIHEQWKSDYRQYERSYNEYLKVEKNYETELNAYNAKVKLAEQEAKARHKEAQAIAKAQASGTAREVGNTLSTLASAFGGGDLAQGAAKLLGNVTTKAVTAATIPYEPYLAAVLAERGLSVKPSKPYNPKPTKPVEPPTGYAWKSYSLRQPCRYDSIDFESISEAGSFADVSRDGKWGLVDSEMKEIIPCENRTKVLQKKYPDGKFLIKTMGRYDVINSSGKKLTSHQYESIERQYGYWLCCDDELWGVYTWEFEELYPCQFQSAKLERNDNKLMLYNKNKGLWGVIDFSAGTEFLPNQYSSIEFTQLGENEISKQGRDAFYKVCSDSKYGLYSDKGVLVVPCSYSKIIIKEVAGRTMIEAHDGTFVSLYETTGIEVLPPGKYTSYQYSENPSYPSYYLVRGADEKLGVCDIYGTELLPCRYTGLEYSIRINGFIASKGRLKGIVSMAGRELFPFVNAQTFELHPLSPEVLVVGTGDEKGYGAIDYKGQLIVRMENKYKNISKKVASVMKKHPLISISFEQKKLLRDDLQVKTAQEALELDKRQKFSFFAQNYVERVVGEWQKKGEFEKADDWRKRVNANTLNQRVYALTKEAQTIYIDEYQKTMPKDSPQIVGSYDPENETYRISSDYSEDDILVKVDSKDALEFKTEFASLRKQPVFFVENDEIGLAEYVFTMPSGAKYKYSNQASLTYSIAEVQYSLDAIEIDKSLVNGNNKRGRQTISTSTLTFGKSDVDMNIPVSETSRPNTFVVIIANENYDNERKVDYAYNDGQTFKDYCQKSLGIPAENIHFRPDATLNHMKYEIGWLKNTTKAFPDAKVLFYYAGHGVPDAYTRESYLLPVDGYGSNIDMTGYKLSDLYASLGELPADNVLVMLDACFSGVDRGGQSMTNVRAVKVTPKKGKPAGNVVVFSATSGQQVAHPYEDQSHGMFTYFLLKKLQDSGGNLNYGEWFDYIKTNVAQKASIVNNKEQTPTVVPAPSIINTWKTITL